MSDRKAIRVLKETPTDYGYTIREEYWEGFKAHVESFDNSSSIEGADHFATELQDAIDDAPDEMLMTTCYTNHGYWIGDLETAKFLCEERGIAPKPQKGVERGVLRPCNIGWCEKEQKWYGWSHRAIHGFGIGSKVSKGDCAYSPVDEADAVDDGVRFWSDDTHLNVKAGEPFTDEIGKRFVHISWTVADTVPNEKIRGTISGVNHYIGNACGNGEWEAKTLEDAKQMALDYAEGVS